MGIDLNNGYRELRNHIGHNLEIVKYCDDTEIGQEWPDNIAIECNDCGEVLLDFDRPLDAYKEMYPGTVSGTVNKNDPDWKNQLGAALDAFMKERKQEDDDTPS